MPGNDLTPAAATLTAGFSSAVPPAPQAAPPATPTAAPMAPTVVEPHSHASITAAEAAQIVGDIRADVSAGRISLEEANRRFDALNVPTEERTLPTDLRNEEQRLIDEQFPVGRAQDFRIAYTDPGQPAMPMTKALSEFDQSARSWLVGGEFPTDLGNSLITEISRVARQTKAMTPDQLESYGMTEYEKLQRAYGDKLEEKLKTAGHMVVALDQKTPGLKNLLRSKGIGDNAMVASLLIQQSERWHARRKGR